jgi:puromycin-sensitive aminopeptidase
MEGKKYKLSLPSVSGGWIKLNPGQSGFYRVAYPDEMWMSLAKAVEAGALPVVDRLGLLDDAFALARAGYLKSSTALAVLMAYRHEKDFSVWRTIAGIFGGLDNLLDGASEQKPFRQAARDFFRPIAAQMTWDKRPGDGHLDTLLRSIAWRNLGAYGDSAAIVEARNRFERFRKEGSLDPDIRQMVYSLVSENGGEKEWQELLAIYNGTELHEERLRALNAGGQSHDIPVLKNLLQFSLSEAVRAQDTPIVLGSMGSHSQGRQLAWEFLKEKWPTFVERYNGGGIKLLSRAMAVANSFTTKKDLEDAESFFGANPVPGTERSVKKILEYVRSTISWLERDGDEIRKYFAGL